MVWVLTKIAEPREVPLREPFHILRSVWLPVKKPDKLPIKVFGIMVATTGATFGSLIAIYYLLF